MAAEILLVEDRESLRSMLAETLAREGYGVEAIATGDEAVRRLSEGRRYALVLTDLKLPGADGLAVLDAALASDASLPVILLTGFGTVETAVVAMKKGAADFLGKPVDAADAARLLRLLSGRTHRVLSAVAVVRGQRIESALNVSRVAFARLSPAWIDAYVAGGEPMDKAGAYAIQGDAARHVRRIDGSHSGIMGLPLYETSRLLRGAGQSSR